MIDGRDYVLEVGYYEFNFIFDLLMRYIFEFNFIFDCWRMFIGGMEINGEKSK